MHQQLWGYKVEWKSVSRGTGGKKVEYHWVRVIRNAFWCKNSSTTCFPLLGCMVPVLMCFFWCKCVYPLVYFLAAYLTFPFPCWSVFISNTGHVYLFASEDTTVLPTGHCLTSNYVVMTACSVPIALEFQHLLQGWGS